MTSPETKEIYIFETHVIPPVDEDDNVSLQPKDLIRNPAEEDKNEAPQAEMTQMAQTQDSEVPESPVNVIPESMEHYRLGHLPFTRMKEMMNQGTLLRRLLKVDTPFCSAS